MQVHFKERDRHKEKRENKIIDLSKVIRISSPKNYSSYLYFYFLKVGSALFFFR
jgi:hypothetical protein